MIVPTIIAIVLLITMIVLAYLPLAYEPNFQNLERLFNWMAGRAFQSYIQQEQAENV
jgi:hypothetical protein